MILRVRNRSDPLAPAHRLACVVVDQVGVEPGRKLRLPAVAESGDDCQAGNHVAVRDDGGAGDGDDGGEGENQMYHVESNGSELWLKAPDVKSRRQTTALFQSCQD